MLTSSAANFARLSVIGSIAIACLVGGTKSRAEAFGSRTPDLAVTGFVAAVNRGDISGAAKYVWCSSDGPSLGGVEQDIQRNIVVIEIDSLKCFQCGNQASVDISGDVTFKNDDDTFAERIRMIKEEGGWFIEPSSPKTLSERNMPVDSIMQRIATATAFPDVAAHYGFTTDPASNNAGAPAGSSSASQPTQTHPAMLAHRRDPAEPPVSGQ